MNILLLGDFCQLRVLFLQVPLLSSQVIVEDDLLLQEIEHQVSDAIRVLDLIGEGLVASLKIIQDARIKVKIILAKDKRGTLVVLLVLLYLVIKLRFFTMEFN